MPWLITNMFSSYRFLLLMKFILTNQTNRFLIFVLLAALPFLVEHLLVLIHLIVFSVLTQ